MNNLINIDQAANWFIEHSTEVTPKKLQKLLYYAYSWGLVFFNERADQLDTRLFNGQFEAWVHGPVNRDVYKEYAECSYNTITKPKRITEEIDNEDVVDLLRQINEVYGRYNGNELERLTHQEEPWNNARGDAKPLDASNTLLDDVEIFTFYGNQLAN